MSAHFMQLPREVILGANILELTGEIAKKIGMRGRPLIVTGKTTYNLAGRTVENSLTANGFAVEICNLAHNIPNISAFDIVVLGTGVRVFRVYSRWKKILKQKALGSKNLFMFLSSGTAIKEPDKAVEKFLRPLVVRYNLNPKSLVSFPGKIPEKWSKLDDQKVTMKPDKAKVWAQEIAGKIQS